MTVTYSILARLENDSTSSLDYASQPCCVLASRRDPMDFADSVLQFSRLAFGIAYTMGALLRADFRHGCCARNVGKREVRHMNAFCLGKTVHQHTCVVLADLLATSFSTTTRKPLSLRYWPAETVCDVSALTNVNSSAIDHLGKSCPASSGRLQRDNAVVHKV